MCCIFFLLEHDDIDPQCGEISFCIVFCFQARLALDAGCIVFVFAQLMALFTPYLHLM